MSKPPDPELPALRKLQKVAMGWSRRVADAITDTALKSAKKLRELDDQHRITQRSRRAVHDLDDRYGLSEKIKGVQTEASRTVQGAASAVRRLADEQGVTVVVRENIVEPLGRAAGLISSSEAVRELRAVTENGYGALRGYVKDVIAPDLPTYDSHELLLATKQELNYIAACILQIPPELSSQLGTQFGRAVTAKIAGAASSAALLGIVATFGHAGTGATIAGLSGAAATSASMAWVGGLVGGGVAAGTALTGGLALVVGLAAYKLLASERRDFGALSELEQRIVQSCWMLAAVADAYEKQPTASSPKVASEFLEKALRPLYRDIEDSMVALCAPLDNKHSVAMRQHVLQDFRSAVLNRFPVYLSWAHSDAGRAWYAELARKLDPSSSVPVWDADQQTLKVLRAGNAEAAIGGAFAALLSGNPLDETTQSRLVLNALRRSSVQLEDASVDELGDYLRAQSPEGLRGVAANVKGIYHELWYVDRYNASHEDTFARVFESTNHPGSDVEIVDADTGAVIRAVQLKAVESEAAVQAHLERFPHIEVAVTDEVAGNIHNGSVEGSGFSNATLTGDVTSRIDELRDHTITARAADTALLALGIASTAELVQMLRGQRAFPDAVLNTAAKVGTAAGATALTALLFS